MSIFLGTQSPANRLVRLLVTLVATFLLFQFVSLYLSYPKQIVVGAVSVTVALVLNRTSKGQLITLSLMLLAMAATLRYAWWRVSMVVQYFRDESYDHLTINAVLMLILLSAEFYTILIMVLGFMQTSAPLQRKPIPLPADEAEWPHIDVLIPTYNEPLSLVRYTALAAINMDYPPEKLHVYILDDGTRDEFREFCEEAGVGYKVRAVHDHAKAGNINRALQTMDSPLVTIFDCDHVPTRSFLQVTVGWFLAEKKLAMLQTPHFFYSPDPFERNLLQYKTIPNEGELFYGLIQDGNDLWNATFFCGSCAVIRREALNEVGGIAVETVTEDAHTSLKMQKLGWNTAYINLPQAAGLATETLSAHVGQRVRWARGMIQIFRTDNPMLARGMKLTQRMCYFNAMLHFLYAVPRLIFLIAPLVYMLAGRTIIPGYWVAILAYALPHLVISSLVNSRVQGYHRHSFWNEIYETVLAPYILYPTLMALINPKLGKFNVTDKGSTLMETRFDRSIAAPTTWLLGFNLLGVLVAPYRYFVADPTHPGTVISNLIWIFFNMVILGVAAAVANEQKQRRSSVRVPAQIRIDMFTQEHGVFTGTTQDMSVGGASLLCDNAASFTRGESINVSFPVQTGDATIRAKVLGTRGNQVSLKFECADIFEEETLTCALYSRADSWINARNNTEFDRPMISLLRVIRLSFTGFHQVALGLLPRRKAPASAVKAAAATSAALLLLLLLTRGLHAQEPGTDNAAATVVATQSVTTVSKGDGVTLLSGDAVPVPAAEANDKVSLRDMGVHDAVELRGPHSSQAIGFVLGHQRVPRRATLNLSYHFSRALAPHSGSIVVSINRTPIARIAAPSRPQGELEYAFVALPVPADLLVRNNELSFDFQGNTALSMDARSRQVALASIGANSTLFVAGDALPFKSDIGLLPLPLFDPELQSTTTLPFVFLTNPTPVMLQAASAVSSWFGMQVTSKPVKFSVTIGQIPRGNAIVFADRPSLLPAQLQEPGGGATLSIRANPNDPNGTVLVLAANDDLAVLKVAHYLALLQPKQWGAGQPQVLLGPSVRVGDLPLPAVTKVDDAPKWLPTDRLTTLWALSSKEGLRTRGSQSLPVYFRVPPDLDYGENQNLNLRLTYRYNATPLASQQTSADLLSHLRGSETNAGSALRVYSNGTLITEIPLLPGNGWVTGHRNVLLPVATMRPFGNTLRLNFDFIPANPNGTGAMSPDRMQGAILEDSYLDVRGLERWAALPNLELFANAGFPFTRHSDLSETTVILPVTPTPSEMELLLTLMAHWGMQTGAPALRVEVAGPDVTMRGDRDYLLLGGVSDQPAFGPLEGALPLTMDANGVHGKDVPQYRAMAQNAWQRLLNGSMKLEMPNNDEGAPQMMIEGIESPQFPGRSIVMMVMRNDDAAATFADVFLERSQSSDIAHTVSLLQHGTFHSYEMRTPIYHVGDIGPYPLMRLWLVQHFWLLMTTVFVLSLLLARYGRDYLALLRVQRLQTDPGFVTPQGV